MKLDFFCYGRCILLRFSDNFVIANLIIKSDGISVSNLTSLLGGSFVFFFFRIILVPSNGLSEVHGNVMTFYLPRRRLLPLGKLSLSAAVVLFIYFWLPIGDKPEKVHPRLVFLSCERCTISSSTLCNFSEPYKA